MRRFDRLWWQPTVTLALTCLCLSLFGCASAPEIQTEYETVVEYRDRPVPVDERLTRDVPPPDLEPVTWLEGVILGIYYKQKYQALRERMRIIRENHSPE